MDQLDMIVRGIFVCGIFFVIFCFIMAFRDYKRNKVRQKELGGNNDPRPAEREYTMVTTKATVVDQVCCVKMVGIKTPKTVKEFTIVFQTENGDILKLNIPEEMYDGFAQGQTGVLSIVDGELYGFELEEDPAS